MQAYEYALAVTSQFYFCALPLRLDAYSRCGFRCLYCYTLSRGGNYEQANTSIANPQSIARALQRATKKPNSATTELLGRGQPIHFGGMSDPFPPLERRLRKSLEILRILADNRYPTLISTKSDLFAEDEYLDVLTKGNFLIQVSLSSIEESLIRQVDIGTAGPTRLLRAMKTATDGGIPVACRIQPLLPGREDHARDLIAAVSSIGITHVGVEHLKVPVEKQWGGIRQLEAVLGQTFLAEYENHGRRVGREWVLPVEQRVDRMLALRAAAHDMNLTFGAADTDLLLLSDGTCCCSGADSLPGFQNHYRCTYTEAARRGLTTGTVAISNITQEWTPKSSIARFVNSRSRLRTASGHGAAIWDYIRHSWNGSPNGNSPASVYGVVDIGEKDENGFAVYGLTEEIRQLVSR